MTEDKNIFAFSINSKYFYIKKGEISTEFEIFLKSLKNNFKNIEEPVENSLDLNLSALNTEKYLTSYVSEKDKNTLDTYFSIKSVRTNLFFQNLYTNFIKLHLILGILFIFLCFCPIAKFTFNIYIFYIFLILFATIFYMKGYIDLQVKKMLKTKAETLYIYDDFLLIKSGDNFLTYSYDSIDSISETNNLIFIKFKKLLSPIIIDRNKISNEEYKFLFDKKHTIIK